MVTRVGFFENASLSFSNTMMSYIIQRVPCEGCYRISIFLAFWCGREKAIQVKLRKQGEKFSVLKNMGIRVHA